MKPRKQFKLLGHYITLGYDGSRRPWWAILPYRTREGWRLQVGSLYIQTSRFPY